MRILVSRFVVVSCCLLATALGCAGITGGRDALDPERRGFLYAHQNRGFRHYVAATYILVYTDNAGGITTKPLTLPDSTRRMTTRPYSFVATNDVELSFANGILGSAKADADATGVPKALIAAAEKAASAAAKAGMLDAPGVGAPEPDRRVMPGPYLFKLIQLPGGAAKLVGSGGVELLVAIPPKSIKKSGEK